MLCAQEQDKNLAADLHTLDFWFTVVESLARGTAGASGRSSQQQQATAASFLLHPIHCWRDGRSRQQPAKADNSSQLPVASTV